jgi:hypothetical protein
VRVPHGVDEAAVRIQLLDEFNIEIGAGLVRWPARSGVSA